MKNQTPLLSIILPTFNRGKYILDAIESIQAMSFRNWELIIIDDGSTDQTNIVISKCLD
jgi:glycosyltransferase involved in cell wall biosynthesis